MSFEVNLSSVDFDEFEKSYHSFDPHPIAITETFHEAIFSPPSSSYHAETAIQFGNKWSEVEHKTQRIAQNHEIAPMDANVSGKVEVTVGWGGSVGTTISGSVSGSVSDNNGNKAEVKVEVESDGSGTATVSAEHEKKSGS